MSSRTVANETVNHLFILYEERWRPYLSNQTRDSGPSGKLSTPAHESRMVPAQSCPVGPRTSFPKALTGMQASADGDDNDYCYCADYF